MKILQKRNWEDITCFGCKSELRIHPRDIYLQHRDGGAFLVKCPVCEVEIFINPPKGLHQQLRHKGWPACRCEGDPHCEQKAGCYDECDWPKDLKYKSPDRQVKTESSAQTPKTDPYRKFLFLEFNQPGMEWMNKEDNPGLCIIQAISPEAALNRWVEDHARYFTEEHIQAEIEDEEDFQTVKDRWGVDVRMYEITADVTPMVWDWMKKVVETEQ